MTEDKQTPNPFPNPRRSASADAALRAEIRRVERMTIAERIRASLSVGPGLPQSQKQESPPVR